MLTSLRPLTAACAALVACVCTSAAEPPIVAKARAYLGTESALENVKSVRYIGTLVTADPADPKKQSHAALELIYQRPDQQRIMATSDKTIEVTALDGYDGWQRITDARDPSKWQQTLLGSEQVKRLRANTFENLAFFRGLERRGGRVEDKGTVTKDGVTCQKLAMIYSPAIVFYKYIDVATGRLVLTENDNGGEIRESGEMIVNGIRFPKSVTQLVKTANGDRTVTMTYDRIALNEEFTSTVFAVPRIR